MDLLSINYRFTLPDGILEEFDLKIDKTSLKLVSPIPDILPAWTYLDFYQCSNCIFSKGKHPFCSVAVNLVELVNRFEKLTSYDEVFVEVITEQRIYYNKTSAQRGISSLMGLMIAVSHCPFTDFFKPMARFHLPFSSAEETIWRAISTYLLSQYFLHKKDQKVDFDLKGLNEIYNNIQKLNVALTRRIRAACDKDSTVNAIIILDVFAKSLPLVIEKSLEKIRPVFER